jgi:hypothetical protein
MPGPEESAVLVAARQLAEEAWERRHPPLRTRRPVERVERSRPEERLSIE